MERGVYKKSKLVYGVGVNDANYVTQKYETVEGKRKQVWICPFYRTWRSMIERCYSEKWHSHHTYLDCVVCDEWLVFSNFKTWMEQQDWEGNHLDKDLLIRGNRVYSPSTSMFVHPKVNIFITDHGKARGDYMIGVYWDKNAGKFKSQCCNPFTKKKEYLGYFTDEREGHLAWKNKKHEFACMLAESEYVSDSRLVEVLKTLYL